MESIFLSPPLCVLFFPFSPLLLFSTLPWSLLSPWFYLCLILLWSQPVFVCVLCVLHLQSIAACHISVFWTTSAWTNYESEANSAQPCSVFICSCHGRFKKEKWTLNPVDFCMHYFFFNPENFTVMEHTSVLYLQYMLLNITTCWTPNTVQD